MNLKGLVKCILQYKKDKDASQLQLIDIYKTQIKRDIISAYEISDQLIKDNKDLFIKSPSFISFLFRLIDINEYMMYENVNKNFAIEKSDEGICSKSECEKNNQILKNKINEIEKSNKLIIKEKETLEKTNEELKTIIESHKEDIKTSNELEKSNRLIIKEKEILEKTNEELKAIIESHKKDIKTSNELEKSNKLIIKEKEILEKTNENLKTVIKSHEEDIKSANRKINQLKEEVSTLQNIIDNEKKIIPSRDYNEQIEKLENNLKVLKDELNFCKVMNTSLNETNREQQMKINSLTLESQEMDTQGDRTLLAPNKNYLTYEKDNEMLQSQGDRALSAPNKNFLTYEKNNEMLQSQYDECIKRKQNLEKENEKLKQDLQKCETQNLYLKTEFNVASLKLENEEKTIHAQYNMNMHEFSQIKNFAKEEFQIEPFDIIKFTKTIMQLKENTHCEPYQVNLPSVHFENTDEFNENVKSINYTPQEIVKSINYTPQEIIQQEEYKKIEYKPQKENFEWGDLENKRLKKELNACKEMLETCRKQKEDLNKEYKNDQKIFKINSDELLKIKTLITTLDNDEHSSYETTFKKVKETIDTYNYVQTIIKNLFQEDTNDMKKTIVILIDFIKNITSYNLKYESENKSELINKFRENFKNKNSIFPYYSIEDVTDKKSPQLSEESENVLEKQKRINSLEERNTELENDIAIKNSELENIYAKYNLLKHQELEKCKGEIEELTKKLRDDDEKSKEENENLVESKKELNKNLISETEKNKKLQAEIQNLRQNLQDNIRNNEDLKARNKKLIEKNDKLQIEKESISQKLKGEIETKARFIAEQTQYNESLREENKNLAHYKNEFSASETEKIKTLQDEIQQLRMQNQNLEDNYHRELNKCHTRLQENMGVIENLQTQTENLKDELNANENKHVQEIAYLKQEHENLQTNNKKYIQKIETLKLELGNLLPQEENEGAGNKLEYVNEEQMRKKERAKEINLKELNKHLQLKLKTCNKQKDALTEELAQCRNDLEFVRKTSDEKLNDIKKKLSACNKELEFLKDDTNYLTEKLNPKKRKMQDFEFSNPIYSSETYSIDDESNMIVSEDNASDDTLRRCILEKDHLTKELEKCKFKLEMFENLSKDANYTEYTKDIENINIHNLKLLFIAFYEYHFKTLSDMYNMIPLPEHIEIFSKLKTLLDNLEAADLNSYSTVLSLYVKNQINTLSKEYTPSHFNFQNTINELLIFTMQQTEQVLKKLNKNNELQTFLKENLQEFVFQESTILTMRDIVSILHLLANIFSTTQIEDFLNILSKIKELTSQVYEKYKNILPIDNKSSLISYLLHEFMKVEKTEDY